jgi:translation initiation factor 3 subunit D
MGSQHLDPPGPVQGVRLGLIRVEIVECRLTCSIPYAPYSKSDKITRIADWHDAADLSRPAGRNAYGGARRQGREAYGASESTAFGYVHEEDERSFSLVDSGARPGNRAKIGGQRGRGGARGAAAGARGARGGRPAAFQPRGGFTSRTGRGGRSGFGDWNKVGRRETSTREQVLRNGLTC